MVRTVCYESTVQPLLHHSWPESAEQCYSTQKPDCRLIRGTSEKVWCLSGESFLLRRSLNADGTRRCDWCTKRRPHLGPPPWPFDPPQPYSPPPPPTPRFTTTPPPLHNNPRNHLVLTIAAHTRPPSARSGFCWHRATAAISETGPFVSYCLAWDGSSSSTRGVRCFTLQFTKLARGESAAERTPFRDGNAAGAVAAAGGWSSSRLTEIRATGGKPP